MAHDMNGFVGRLELLSAATPYSAGSVVAPLDHGWGLMIDPADKLGIEPELGHSRAQYGASLGKSDAVAYVATEYFGGTGEQAAAAWRNGQIAWGYSVGSVGIINRVLQQIGVILRQPGGDEFDAIGLGWYRSSGDWAMFARKGTTGKQWDLARRPQDVWTRAKANGFCGSQP